MPLAPTLFVSQASLNSLSPIQEEGQKIPIREILEQTQSQSILLNRIPFDTIVEVAARAGHKALGAISLTCKALKHLTRGVEFLRSSLSFSFPPMLKVYGDSGEVDPLKLTESPFASFKFLERILLLDRRPRLLNAATIVLTGPPKLDQAVTL